jgi:hypothetical protein
VSRPTHHPNLRSEEDPMDHADDAVASAPLPTPKTVRARNNLPLQAWRFVAINLRMVKIIRKGHH